MPQFCSLYIIYLIQPWPRHTQTISKPFTRSSMAGHSYIHKNRMIMADANQTTTLGTLPTEIKTTICDFLDHDALTPLMCVDKAWHQLIEPMIWTAVELHRPGFHASYRYPDAADFQCCNMPLGHLATDWVAEHYQDWYSEDGVCVEMATRFISTFTGGRRIEEDAGRETGTLADRYYRLAGMVRHLCLTVDLRFDDDDHHSHPDWQNDCWSVFYHFRNLEHLEIVGRDPYPANWRPPPAALFPRGQGLPKLHSLRLRGHLPRGFVRYICELAAPNLVDLELAILDKAVDGRAERDDSQEDDCVDSNEDEEDEDGEDFSLFNGVAPRPLACLTQPGSGGDMSLSFPRLARLYLCKPTSSSRDIDDPADPLAWGTPFVSIRSDTALLREWAHLLRRTSPSLEHLILDQRPALSELGLDSTGGDEFLAIYPYGPGYDRFVEHVLVPVLLDEDIAWPRLRTIRLYGFDVPEELNGFWRSSWPRPTGPQPGENRLLSRVRERFDPLGVDVGSSLGRGMAFRSDGGMMHPGDGCGWEAEPELKSL